MEWKESVIRNTLETKLPENERSEEDTGILELLREALQVAKDSEGLIPTAQIYHVYQAVKKHVLGNNKKTQKQKSQEGKRKNKKSKRAGRCYVYAKTKDMFKSNPAQLAKSAREGTEWLSKVETQLEGEDIESLYKELWGNRPTIVQPFTKELESGGKTRELETMMPAISTQRYTRE